MKRRTQIAAAGAAAIVAGGFGTGAVAAGADSEDDAPITGAALDRAEQAALAEIGEGTVTATEVDDEESKYEVEVTREDGSQVDVQLDESFTVVGEEAEEGDEAEGADSADE